MRTSRRMARAGWTVAITFALMAESRAQQTTQPEQGHAYLGFDRNEYPGDQAMAILRKQFSFVGYWLSPPPAEWTNGWAGKRANLEAQGFGFALLYRGRSGSSLHGPQAARAAGEIDAKKAAEIARREGFTEGWTIFLDMEEGGRFNDAGHAYFRAWAEALAREHYRPAFYCSGMVVHEEGGAKVITADDIRAHLGPIDAAYWVFNDACPPSPGCVNPKEVPEPAQSGVAYALVWQISRTPKESVARQCGGYTKDKSCYAAVDLAQKWSLDLDVAASASPSAPAN
jgi:Domain of unknown function (DUF1906)